MLLWFGIQIDDPIETNGIRIEDYYLGYSYVNWEVVNSNYYLGKMVENANYSYKKIY
ncbi:hypothetical protein [Helicovermis profundi]|uniref:hypothetical protein n=1 Tax=Helicovermis profundi TaxID=3065157 RepID=UPI0030D601EA